MIGEINIVFNVGMAHVLCGAVVLPIIIGTLPAFVLDKLLQKRRNNKEQTLVDDKVDALQRELEVAHRRNDNLKKIINDRIRKECGEFLTTEKFDKELGHIQDLLDLAQEADVKLQEADVKLQEAENKVEAIGKENQELQRKGLDDEKAMTELRREILKLKDTNMEREKELCEKQRQIQEMKAFIVAKEEKLCNNENETEELKRQNALKDEKLEDYQRVIDELQKERAGKNKETVDLETKAKDSDELASRSKRNKENHIQNLAKSELEMGDLKTEVEMLRSQNAELFNLLSQQRKILDLEQKLQKMEDYQQEKDDLERALKDKEMEINDLKRENEDNRNEIQQDLGKQIALKEKNLQECLQGKKDLMKELEKRRQDINKLLFQNQRYQDELKKRDFEIEEFRKQVEREQVCQLEKAGARFQQMIDDLRNQTCEQETEVIYLRNEVQQKNNLLEECTAQLDSLNKKMERLEEENKHLRHLVASP